MLSNFLCKQIQRKLPKFIFTRSVSTELLEMALCLLPYVVEVNGDIGIDKTLIATGGGIFIPPNREESFCNSLQIAVKASEKGGVILYFATSWRYSYNYTSL